MAALTLHFSPDGQTENRQAARSPGLKALAADFAPADARMTKWPFWHGEWPAMDSYLSWGWRAPKLAREKTDSATT